MKVISKFMQQLKLKDFLYEAEETSLRPSTARLLKEIPQMVLHALQSKDDLEWEFEPSDASSFSAADHTFVNHAKPDDTGRLYLNVRYMPEHQGIYIELSTIGYATTKTLTVDPLIPLSPTKVYYFVENFLNRVDLAKDKKKYERNLDLDLEDFDNGEYY